MTVNPLWQANRSCTACALESTCQGPVPANGPFPAQVMFIGEAPGANEDKDGYPFTGQSGKFLNSLLQYAGLAREEVLISNLVKCRPPKNRDPLTEEVAECAYRWLDQEILMAQPRIIVALGRFAAGHVLGRSVRMSEVHGRPFSDDRYIILPVYHPAAGLRDKDGAVLQAIYDDFAVLKELVAGADPEKFLTVDKYPNPEYFMADGFTDLGSTNNIIQQLGGPIAIDTETVDGELWSVQISPEKGVALLLTAEQISEAHRQTIRSTATIAHNWLYDQQLVSMPNFMDTMVMAYLLGLPQGLKDLAKRLCGMEMHSYRELVGGYRQEKALKYLREVAKGLPWEGEYVDWSDPLVIEDLKWNKKTQTLSTVTKKPRHIMKKVAKLLTDVHVDPETDAWERWNKWDESERAEVETALGLMPDADLNDVPIEDAVWYGCRDADATLRVYDVLIKRIHEAGLQMALHTDLATLPVAAEMMSNGIKVDVEYLKQLSDEFLADMHRVAESEIFPLAGYRFNPNSDNELRKLFFSYESGGEDSADSLGFTPTKFTPTGLPSVVAKELSKIDHPLVEHVLKYKHLAHLRDSFTETLPRTVDSDGRIHTTIKPTRTATGRWSMAEPNLQQIPVRSEEGRKIRGAFISEEGWTLLAADYSQIEMRVAAHLSQCKSMIQMFQEGRDIHTETAAQVFGLRVEDVTREERYPAKTMGFGVIYGLTPYGLFSQMQEDGVEGWTEDRCEEFIKEYYRLRPELRDWQDRTKMRARLNGYTTDMFGRRRMIPKIMVPISRVRSEGEREAMNMPVQSSAQGIIKMAMCRMHQSDTYTGRWLLQIHDELIWEVPYSTQGWFATWVRDRMQNVVSISTPLEVGVKVGDRWDTMKEVL